MNVNEIGRYHVFEIIMLMNENLCKNYIPILYLLKECENNGKMGRV